MQTSSPVMFVKVRQQPTDGWGFPSGSVRFPHVITLAAVELVKLLVSNPITNPSPVT